MLSRMGRAAIMGEKPQHHRSPVADPGPMMFAPGVTVQEAYCAGGMALPRPGMATVVRSPLPPYDPSLRTTIPK